MAWRQLSAITKKGLGGKVGATMEGEGRNMRRWSGARGVVRPKFSGVPLTSRQLEEVSTLGHCAPKSWYRTGTIYSWTPSYSAPPQYVPSP